MNLTSAFITVLASQCSWFDTTGDVARQAVILPPGLYEVFAEGYGQEPKTRGFAVWKKGDAEPEQCRVFLRWPTDIGIACHELKHCVVGEFHG